MNRFKTILWLLPLGMPIVDIIHIAEGANLGVNYAVVPAYDYALRPRQIAQDTYLLEGSTHNFSLDNGGNIQNTAFVVTGDGVIVWDSGPSRLYGEQLKVAVASVTKQKIKRVYISHHHPDHMLGIQAFSPEAATYALKETIQAIKLQGDDLAENLYRLVGEAMSGTEAKLPDHVANSGSFTLGTHTFVLHALAGHTAGDLVLEDKTSGVVFVGDLVFNNRAATTPNAEITVWLSTLDFLSQLDFRILVPGHGAIDTGHDSILQTRDYLTWLTHTLQDRAKEGADMAEVLDEHRPERFQLLDEGLYEFQRSVSHLFPGYEQKAFPSRTRGLAN